jgi:hypothetical protein
MAVFVDTVPLLRQAERMANVEATKGTYDHSDTSLVYLWNHHDGEPRLS